MTIKRKDPVNISFADLAEHTIPQQIPAEESEKLVNSWVTIACLMIEHCTGTEPKHDDVLIDLSDSQWIFLCQNPNDDEDEADYIDLRILGSILDGIVEETIGNIWEEQDEEAADHRFFKDSEDNVYTKAGLRYEYDSFMETLPEDDEYHGMTFEDWIDEWWLSGFDTKEITEEEYNLAPEEKKF